MYCLIVDDDPLMVELASRALRAAGHSVEGALSAEAGLRSMRTRKPSLVLLDARMPGMDGFAMLNLMKADPAWVDVPVIMLTGLRARADVLKAQECGASGYVLKPFDQKILLRRVSACLERREASPGSVATGDHTQATAAASPHDTWLL